MILTLFRYAHVPLFDTYLLTLHPYIILLSSYLIYFLINRYFLTGVFALIIVFIGSFYTYVKGLRWNQPIASDIARLEKVLIRKYPDKSFAIYDYKDSAVGESESLSLYLYGDNKINDYGQKVGISTSKPPTEPPVIYSDNTGYILYDLSKAKAKQLRATGWDFVNPSSIYHKVQDWFKK